MTTADGTEYRGDVIVGADGVHSVARGEIPGWTKSAFDSGKKILLILAVEERFGIYTQSEEIDALRRIGDWVALVLRHSADAA